MTTDELLIHELAARAGISVRTIRYYIDEGLLPQPNYQGKYSYYSLRYLDRLELIRRLKESYLPLREIREIMSSLTDDQVKRRLKELPPSNPKFTNEQTPDQPNTRPGAEALKYINRLMDDQTKYRTKGTVNQPQPTFLTHRELTNKQNISMKEQISTDNDETWHRVSLAPGVELHYRRPMDPDTESLVKQLVSFAKRIFHRKSQGGNK